MNILFLSLRFPYPPHRGDKIRGYNFIKHLAQKHSLFLVSYVESADEADMYAKSSRELGESGAAQIQQYCDSITLVPFCKRVARMNAILHSCSKKPLQIWYWYSAEMQRAIDGLFEQHDFDIIQVQFFRLAQYVTKYKDCPKVLDLTDAMSLNLHRRAQLDRGISWPLVKLEELRVRKYETEIVKQFNMGTLVSDFDRDYLLALDDSLKLDVVPMGVDLEYFCPSDVQYEPQLLFTGTMNYFPNSDAVWYFYHQILPYVTQSHPNVKFYVVGNHPPSKLKRLGKKRNIVVTGHVPDTRPYFAKSAVFVSPLRGGSGMQTKNLEAMAMGVPVVTTSVGAGGIDEATPGHDLLVADEPKEFAAKVIQLLEDHQLRQEIVNNGRRLVEDKYNWDSVVSRLDRIYEQICSS